jgi:hypothetical protein
MEPSGTDPPTFRLVALCLTQLRGHVLRNADCKDKKIWTGFIWFSIGTSGGLASCLEDGYDQVSWLKLGILDHLRTS